MLLNKFDYLGTVFIVQSYLKNDFANICEINGESYQIDFLSKSITTTGKETKTWKQIASQINFSDIENILNSHFN